MREAVQCRVSSFFVPGTRHPTAKMAKKPIQKKSKKAAKKGGRRK